MSGRRQHYIPRFIQKGFSSKKKKKQYYTWVFKKDRQPYECNLINVGLEIDFYGNPSESMADNKITNSEGKYIDLIEDIRSRTGDIALDSMECASLIGHMQIRAKGSRESIHEIGEAFLSGAKEKLDKIDKPEIIVKHLIKTQRKEVANSIKDSLPKHLSEEQKFLLTKYCLDNPKKWISRLPPSSWKQFLVHFGILIEELPNLIKDSHNQALEKTSVAKGFMKTCSDFNWQLVYSPDENFIFGDIGAIGNFSPNNEYRSLMFIKDSLREVIMPVSSCHAIVGNHKAVELSKRPIEEINGAIARLSRNFFISSSKNTQTIELSNCIAEKSSMIGEPELNILKEKLKDIVPK